MEGVTKRGRIGWSQLALLAAAVGLCAWGVCGRLGLFGRPGQSHPTVAVSPGQFWQRPGASPRPAVLGDATPIDCARTACLVLSFDDGPNPATTPQILDVLERHHLHATFFVIGVRVPGNEALLRRMHADGDEIGNHTWAHPDLTTLSPVQIQQQIAQAQSAIVAAGVPAPTLFRPPYGAVNAVVKNNVPLTFAMWNIDPDDWKAKDPHEVVQRVEAAAAPGRVVDLHDTSPVTVAALDQLLTDLSQHYQLVTFSELFNLAPGQPGEFFGR